MHARTAVWLLCSILLAGCGKREAPTPQLAGRGAAPAPYEVGAGAAIKVPYSLYPGTVFPVQVKGPGGTRDVAGLYVADSATLAGSLDSLVLAAAFNAGGAMVGVMRFHAYSGRIDTLPTPRGYSPNLTPLAASPDGRYIAYVEVDGGAPPFGVVRRVTDQVEVARTPPIPVAGVSAQLGLAHWTNATRFDIAIILDPAADRWVRFRGEVGSGKIAQDTVAGSAGMLAP